MHFAAIKVSLLSCFKVRAISITYITKARSCLLIFLKRITAHFHYAFFLHISILSSCFPFLSSSYVTSFALISAKVIMFAHFSSPFLSLLHFAFPFSTPIFLLNLLVFSLLFLSLLYFILYVSM